MRGVRVIIDGAHACCQDCGRSNLFITGHGWAEGTEYQYIRNVDGKAVKFVK